MTIEGKRLTKLIWCEKTNRIIICLQETKLVCIVGKFAKRQREFAFVLKVLHSASLRIMKENWISSCHLIKRAGLILHVKLHKRYLDIECPKLRKIRNYILRLLAIVLIFIHSIDARLKIYFDVSESFTKNFLSVEKKLVCFLWAKTLKRAWYITHSCFPKVYH